MFDRKGREVKKRHFSTGGSYSSSVRQGCFQLRGDRVITLGLNMSVISNTHTHTHIPMHDLTVYLTPVCHVFLKVLCQPPGGDTDTEDVLCPGVC